MSDDSMPAAELPQVALFDRILERVSDLANPILVKEVRQALRGRFFRIAFSIILFALCVVTTGYIMDASTHVGRGQGRELFEGIYIWLGLALFGLVPFGTFASMGNEWDENTFDLLVLSNLKPWRIIWGKLLSAAVQSLLYLVTFAPFMACAFLMQGVDLFALGFLMLGAFLWSLVLSVVAIALSTLSKQRVARIFMMAVLAGGLSMAYGMALSMSMEMMSRPGRLSGPQFLLGVAAFWSVALYIAAFLFCMASNSLAHPEENRSSNLRVVSSLGLLAGMAWLTYVSSQSPDASALTAGCIFLLIGCLVIPSLVFITEPNPMGRRVAFSMPRGPVSSLLSIPWLPGGGRGVIFFLLHAGLLVLFYLVAGLLLLKSPGEEIAESGAFAFLGLVLYFTGYLLIPAGLLSGSLHRLPIRILARVGAPLLMLFLLFLPALTSFLLGGVGNISMSHVGNPVLFLSDQWSGLDGGLSWMVLGAFAGLALLLNLARTVRGYREVGEVQARHLERD